MIEDEAFAEQLREQTLKAFGLKPWDITGAVRPPWRVRFWRAVTFAKRRGKVIDWDRFYCSSEQHRGDCCVSCMSDAEEGYRDWDEGKCCCKAPG